MVLPSLIQQLYQESMAFTSILYCNIYDGIYRSKKLIWSRGAQYWHSSPLTVHQYKGRRGHYIKFGGKNIEKLFHYLYDGVPESQYLKRKYDIFQSSLERVYRRKSPKTTSEDALAFYVHFLDPDGIPRLIYFRTEAEMLKFKENLEQDAIL
jgi:hypothetical protein